MSKIKYSSSQKCLTSFLWRTSSAYIPGILACILCFLRAHPQHMEVLRLGVELELHLPAYATATATQDPSHICNLHHSSQWCWILNPLSEARHWSCVFMDTHGVLPLSQDENSLLAFCSSSRGTHSHSLLLFENFHGATWGTLLRKYVLLHKFSCFSLLTLNKTAAHGQKFIWLVTVAYMK